jgi:dolichol-phosphate mannosyltransferase
MSLLSVIIPAYNEEANILHAISTVSAILQKEQISYELLFISDGSADNTYAIVEEESRKDNRIKGADFSRNFGKEAAIFAGLRLAQGDCCVVIDCDLQHPPECIIQMVRLWEQGYEIVEGIKANRGNESFGYKLSAGLFYKIISKLTQINMESSSDFKLIDRKVVDVLAALPERNTFFRALSFWSGFKSTTVEYEVAQRQFGKSKWSIKSLIKYAVSNITSFTTVPLQIVTVMGISLLVLSIVLGIQTLVRYCMGQAVQGFTTVILLLLIIGGSIMMSLGIIGHYVAKVYEEVKGRPKYIITHKTENLK